MKKEVLITSAVRTAMGSFMGQFANVPVTHLGAAAIKGALVRANFDGHRIDEVFMGHVLQAGAKQAPARNAALLAGVSDQTPCTTVNKVCSSGLKAVMFAAQAIQCDDAQVVVAGGMESMSMTPHYLRARAGAKFGNLNLLDGIMEDGLTDAQDGSIMGSCAELCAKEHDFDRKAQDDYARSSYQRAAKAWDNGLFKDEIIAVDVPQGKGNSLSIIEDEEYKRVNFDKMSELRPSFQKDGTVTAANASTLNDGASALLIMNREQSDAAQLKPLARILSYADAARDAARFTIAPSLAIPKALDKAGLKIEDIDFFEINEAFSVVALANIKLLGLGPEKVNIKGGAVSLGHPLGNSGSRILVTLIHTLIQNGKRYGVAGICNGGGGASAMVIENLTL